MTASRTAALAALVDPLLDAPAVVLGGLPGRGRDLDLLVDDPAPLVAALVARGFTAGAAGLRRLVEVDGGVRADVVEALPPGELGLPAAAVAALRSSALPLPPYASLRRPHPAHVLLLLAARGVGALPLSEGHGERVGEALADRADVAARTQAGGWGIEAELEVLLRRAAGRAPGPLLRLQRSAAAVRRAGHRGPSAALRTLRHALPRRPAPATPPLVVPAGALGWLPLLLADLGHPDVPLRSGGADAPPLEVAALVCAALGV